MTTLKIELKNKGFKNLKMLFPDAAEKIGSPESMTKYGEQAAGMIKLRTRLGSGVADDDGDKERLKPLSGKSSKNLAMQNHRIAYARQKVETAAVHVATTAKGSKERRAAERAHHTAQKTLKGHELKFAFSGGQDGGYIGQREADQRMGRLSDQTTPATSNLTRTGQLLDSVQVRSVAQNSVRVGPEGERSGGKLTNEELAGYVTQAGRPFNHLSKTELKRVREAIAKDLREEMKRRLTAMKK
jgi:hypothetical protein